MIQQGAAILSNINKIKLQEASTTTKLNMATKMFLMTTKMNPKCGTGPILIGFITIPKLFKDYLTSLIGNIRMVVGGKVKKHSDALTRQAFLRLV